MRAASNCSPEVMGEGADVRAARTFDDHARHRTVDLLDIELGNVNRPGLPFDLFSLPGVVVERPAVALDGAVHRGYLLDQAREASDHIGQDRLNIRWHWVLGDN